MGVAATGGSGVCGVLRAGWVVAELCGGVFQWTFGVPELWQDGPPLEHRHFEEQDGQQGSANGGQPEDPVSCPPSADDGGSEGSGGVGARAGQGAFCIDHQAK